MNTPEDLEILDEFVSSLATFDEMLTFEGSDSIQWQLRKGKVGKLGNVSCRPRKVKTPRRALKPLYEKLPVPFPPLYEWLVLNYRWAEVEAGPLCLLANAPGSGLEGLEKEIFKDSCFVENLIPKGYVQFAKAPNYNYDPVCFDTSRNPGSREFPIVQLDHEQILCNDRIEVVNELAPNFRELVLAIIQQSRGLSG